MSLSKKGIITRRIDWVSSLDPENHGLIRELEGQLSRFYASNPDYYKDIDFTSSNWINLDEKGYAEIVSAAEESKQICEIGCGSANILKHHKKFENRYSGCDFSQALMSRNKRLYPQATFTPLGKPNILPFGDEMFDLVFSVFVIEHSTNPAKFLEECSRILKPGGRLMILCPDFLGKSRMTSQRSGYSAGTTSQKIKSGKLIDALVTFFDNRIRIPLYSKILSEKAKKSPLFLINTHPIVFEDNFLPDVDAVYVTFKPEIETFLRDSYLFHENNQDLKDYERKKRVIFLNLQKSLES